MIFLLDGEILCGHNYSWQAIETPIKVQTFKRYLVETNYDPVKTEELIQGFLIGFDLGYCRPSVVQDLAENIPLRVGTKTDLWNKVMKEVQANRLAGPYDIKDLPFEHFVQSPVGLVPKANNKLHLIFHLSYDFEEKAHQKSINYHAPDDLCSVHYQNLDQAVQESLRILETVGKVQKTLVFAKSDFSNAFRILPILVRQRKYLLLMAYHPVTGKKWFFIDLCLPFGSSRSCALFQQFSDAVKHDSTS